MSAFVAGLPFASFGCAARRLVKWRVRPVCGLMRKVSFELPELGDEESGLRVRR